MRAFFHTSLDVIQRPTHFYRTTTTRGDLGAARQFGRLHWLAASILFSAAGAMHTRIFFPSSARLSTFVVLLVATYATLWATTWAATRLTAWEAAYRGIRLPLPVVQRGMYYHAAHYLPVAWVAVMLVNGYAAALLYEYAGVQTVTTYLYVLCAAVIVAAAYLFHTYWIGMRNMMYANR